MAKDMTGFWPEVVQVVPADDFGVYAYFNDGSVHLVDVKPQIKPGTVFAPLADPETFKTRLAVVNGTVGWYLGDEPSARDCVDLDPFTIFKTPAVADPLREVTA